MDKYCPNCKTKIEDGKKFCGKCGFKIPDSHYVAAKQPKRNNKSNIVIAICAIVCIVSAAILGGIIKIKHNSVSENYSKNSDIEDVSERSFKIKSTEPFENSLAWITASDKDNKETYDFVINTDGKALGCVNEGGSRDIVVGENGIVATPESLGYTSVAARGNGYTFVIKETDDDKCNFGIVDYDGNWEVEPARIFEKVYLKNNAPVIDYVGDGIFQVDYSHFYNTNTHSWFEVQGVKQKANFENGVTVASGLVIHDDGSYSQFATEGVADNEKALFSDGVIYGESSCKVYNANGDVLADLSDYKICNNIEFHDGYSVMVFDVTKSEYSTSNIDEYITVIDKTGKQMFEPICMLSKNVGMFNNNRLCIADGRYDKSIMDEYGNEIVDVRLSLNDVQSSNSYSCGWLSLGTNYLDVDGNYMFKDGIINVDKEVLDKGEAL